MRTSRRAKPSRPCPRHEYLNQEYDLAEVELPERTDDCKDDAKSGGDPEQYKCAYDITVIEKLKVQAWLE